MRNVKNERFFCVQCSTAAEFESRINQILAAVSDPQITFRPEPFTAYILGTYWDKVPETIRDDFAMRDEEYCCKDCPYFIRSNDRRRRWHNCGFNPGPVREETPACNEFLRHLKKRKESENDQGMDKA